VLDFFAGSGVTGEAVLKQNAADQGNRKYICVQIPEPLDKPEARLRTIADITRQRLRGVKESLAPSAHTLDLDGRANLDLGFRAYKLTTSNFKPWTGDPANIDSVARQLEVFTDNVIEGRTSEDILSEILLLTGFELTTPVERLTLAGKEVFSVAGGALLVCLEGARRNRRR
jgi:adenine-specific DNA-methyltransferase